MSRPRSATAATAAGHFELSACSTPRRPRIGGHGRFGRAAGRQENSAQRLENNQPAENAPASNRRPSRRLARSAPSTALRAVPLSRFAGEDDRLAAALFLPRDLRGGGGPREARGKGRRRPEGDTLKCKVFHSIAALAHAARSATTESSSGAPALVTRMRPSRVLLDEAFGDQVVDLAAAQRPAAQGGEAGRIDPLAQAQAHQQEFVALLLGAEQRVLDQAVAFALDLGQPHFRVLLGRLGAAAVAGEERPCAPGPMPAYSP